MAKGNIMNIAIQMTRVTMVTVFAIVSLNKHTEFLIFQIFLFNLYIVLLNCAGFRHQTSIPGSYYLHTT
jgi:hypothetical protein